jgi:hypothetical protein
MQNEKPLEVEILDRFFKQIEADPDIPAVVVEDLLNLRKKGALSNSELVIQAIRGGIDGKA